MPEVGSWRKTVAALLERGTGLRVHEHAFLRDVTAFRRLSCQQRYWIATLKARALPPAQD
jgi:hypothetical protein